MNDKPKNSPKATLLRVLTNRWLIIAATVLVIYTLLGFFLFPYAVGHYVRSYGSEKLDRRLTIEKVRFNPFTLTLHAVNFKLDEKDGAPILAFDSLSARLRPSSLYYRAWTFSEITIETPFLNVVAEKDGSSNVSKILKDLKGGSRPSAKSGAPKFLLEHVSLQGGRFDFTDTKKVPPANVLVQSIAAELEDLTDIPQRTGGYTISGRTKDGEKIEWKGKMCLNPLQSEGSMKMESVRTSKVWDFLKEPTVPFVPEGEMDLEGYYLFELQEPLRKLSLDKVKLSLSSFSLAHADGVKMLADRIGIGLSAKIDWKGDNLKGSLTSLNAVMEDFSLRSPGAEKPLLKLARGEVHGGEIDLPNRKAKFDRVRLTSGNTEIVLEKDGKANWSFLAELLKTSSVAGQSDSPPAHAGRERPGWTAFLNSLEVRDFRIFLTDLTTAPPASITLEPAELILNDVSTDPASAMKFQFQTTAKGGGEISVSGTAAIKLKKGEGEINVREFPLLPLQPYLNRLARLRVESGKVNTSGHFTYNPAEEKHGFGYQGKIDVSSFRLVEKETGDPLLSWELLSSSGMNFTLWPNALSIQELDLTKPGAKLIIEENRKLNVSELMLKQDTEEQRATAAQGMHFAVERVRVKDASLHFADLSLKPQFGTLIHNLKGAVNGISSVQNTEAGIGLDGEVDKYGTAHIRGKMNVFEPIGSTHVTMDFRNIDMTHLTPYAVRFAGYRIASGKLSLVLQYRIKEGEVVGKNRIIADHFTLGERVENPTALNLPIALAVALLKDPNGRIDIGLPVQGDLRNPHFDFGGLISKALAGLLTRIVTAPFGWLAGLVGAEKEDLDVLLFDPGMSVLPPPEKEKLNKLSEALKKRPELRLEVRGGYDPKPDIHALRSMLMGNRLAAKEGRALKPGENPGPVVFHNPDTQADIEALFLEHHSRDQLSKLRAEYEKSLEAKEKSAEEKDSAAAWAGFYRSLYHQEEENMEIPGRRLEEIGNARAAVVKQYLVENCGIDEARIGLLQPAQTGTRDNKEVITKLSLAVAK